MPCELLKSSRGLALLGAHSCGPYTHRHHRRAPQPWEERRHTLTGEPVCQQEHMDPRADGPTHLRRLIYGLVVVPMSLILCPQLHTPRAAQGASGTGSQAPLCRGPPSSPGLVAASWTRAWRLTRAGAWLKEVREGLAPAPRCPCSDRDRPCWSEPESTLAFSTAAGALLAEGAGPCRDTDAAQGPSTTSRLHPLLVAWPLQPCFIC